MSPRDAPRAVRRWLAFLDEASVFRSRIYVYTWVPVGVAVMFAETPNPAWGRGPWVAAVVVASLVGWGVHLLLGVLVPRIRRRVVRQVSIPFAFALVGLARGGALGLLAEAFSLLDDHLWGVRVLGGLLGGLVLMSAVAAVERAGAQLVELQREARLLRQQEASARHQPSEHAQVLAWVDRVRAIAAAHFDETAWTPAAQAALARAGSEALVDRLVHQTLTPVRPAIAPLPIRPRLAGSVEFGRFVELATVRIGGATGPLAAIAPLAVLALHGGAARSVDHLAATLAVSAAVTSVVVVGALLLERGLRFGLRRVPLAGRFAIITLHFAGLGVVAGAVAVAVHRLLLPGGRVTVESLMIGVLPVVIVLVGWCAIVLVGVDRYATLLRRENLGRARRLASDAERRDRAQRALADRAQRAVDLLLVPLVRVLAERARRQGVSWFLPATRERVLAAIDATGRACLSRDIFDSLDAIPVEWAGLVLVDIYVDDDVAPTLADVAAAEAIALADRVRALVATAAVERTATNIEVTLTAGSTGITLRAVDNGVHAAPSG